MPPAAPAGSPAKVMVSAAGSSAPQPHAPDAAAPRHRKVTWRRRPPTARTALAPQALTADHTKNRRNTKRRQGGNGTALVTPRRFAIGDVPSPRPSPHGCRRGERGTESRRRRSGSILDPGSRAVRAAAPLSLGGRDDER